MLFWTAFLLAGAAPAGTMACPTAPTVTFDEQWHRACEAAIAATADPRRRAELLYRSAYAHNEHEGYFEAQRALQEAVRLDPASVTAWEELSYTENSLGNYAPAEQAADRALVLAPEHVQPYQERAMARHYQARLEGAWADRDRLARLDPGDAGRRLGRADEAMWLGRFDAAAADLDAAASGAHEAELRQQIEHARGVLQLWRTRSAAGDPAAACASPRSEADVRRPGLIGDCTAAFLAEPRPARRAEFLSIRAIAWHVAAQDLDAATEDRQIAVALDPGNADLRSNLGFSYLEVHHSWAARREFDRALAIREHWSALAGRAAARYNLQDPDGAVADASRSIALRPNDVALTILGDVAKDRGDTEAARRHWLAAWRLGSRDDGLIRRLREIGIEHPEAEAPPPPPAR